MNFDKIKEKAGSFWEKAVAAAKKIGAKNMIILCAVLVCGVAVALNFIISGNNEKKSAGYKIDPDYYAGLLTDDSAGSISADADGTDDGDDYFATAVYNRDRARDEAIEVLATVVSNDTALNEIRQQAEADIEAIAAEIAVESNIEELVRARGIEDCVAIVNGENASVIVKSEGLLPSDIARITEIVYEQANILPVNLNIIERK